jgi:bacteriocin-like protein
MKELTFQELQEIEGGGFWDGFCTGIGIADGAYAIGAGLAYYGVITVSSGPAAPAVGIALGVATLGCLLT